MTLTFTILGCGNSAGTPTIGNYWGQCDPHEPKNRRTRASLAIQSGQTTLVIDTGPDFRNQLNRENITNVDAVLYSHPHSDHIHGIDELRVLRVRHKKIVPIYGNRTTIGELKERFSYMFKSQHNDLYPQVLDPFIFEDEEYGKPFTIGDIDIIPYRQDHGTCESLGYRFGDVAYSTDVVNFSEETLETLKGTKTWILDVAGYNMPKNVVHLTLKRAYEYNEIVQADKVIVMHLSPQMDYKTLASELPDGYEVAYDGLKFSVER